MHKIGKRSRDHAMKQARAMRDQAMVIAMKRKEEYLGARVPKELKERVMEKAKALNIPISILIRRILEDAFSGDGVPETADRVEAVSPKLDFSDVIGWKSVELYTEQACDACATALPAGGTAAMGFTHSGANNVIICPACKGRL